MGVLVGGSRAATGPATGFCRVFAFHSSRLALTKKEANQSDFPKRKRNGLAGVDIKRNKHTCRSDPSCLPVVAGKRSCASDRSNTLG